jgi:hypothetical protein
MRKYGIEKFHVTPVWTGSFSGIDRIQAFEKLKQLERYFIGSFNTFSPNGYNLTKGGDGSVGYRHSEQTINLLKSKKVSEETKDKMAISRSKWKHSAEHRKKISISLLGNKRRLGIPHSKETKERISSAGKGRKHSEETKRKMRESALRYLSEVNNQPRTKRGAQVNG